MNLNTSKLTQRAFYIQCSAYLFLIFLSFTFNSAFLALDREDGLVENIGAISLLITSIILFTNIKFTKKYSYKFWMILAASIAFFWACGEEISWGQHILGTETPEWLSKINGQNETNIHNINKKFFDRTLERLTVLLTLITAIAHFRGKETFLKFRLPEYSLNMAFMMLPIYRKLQTFNNDVWHMGFAAFLGYPIWALIKKDYKVLKHSIAFIIVTLTVWYVHHNYIHLFDGKSNMYHEVRESMFSVLCIFFALQMKKDLKSESSLPQS